MTEIIEESNFLQGYQAIKYTEQANPNDGHWFI